MAELDAGIGGGEAPVDAGCRVVAGLLPGRDLSRKGRLIGNAPVQALAAQDVEFDLSEPKALHLL